ncbi:MAG: choice-of-anchor B family protein [Chloroflexota bacterium]
MIPISRLAKTSLALILLLVSFTVLAGAQTTRPDILKSRTGTVEVEPMSNIPCVDGKAGGVYNCSNVDLLSLIPLGHMGGGSGSDIWGWTDPETGHEYALMARSNGVAFVDISDPSNPVYVGNLPSRDRSSAWRDVKIYDNHAFIVADSQPNHGVQIFDLGELRRATDLPVTFETTAAYDEIGSAHNIFINEETAYGYIVGASSCAGGLHMINFKRTTQPEFAGCFSDDGYTHDAQCVVYNGPDAAHVGNEICFNSNEDTLTIVDVSEKSAPQMLAREGYPGSAYTHQGWLTSDQTHFIMNDEIDEGRFGHNTHTYIWDVSDLDNPIFLGPYTSDNTSIDHNLYIHNDVIFQSNYTSGLRLFEAGNLAAAELLPLGHFDTYPANDNPSYNGSWSNYPFFASGTIVVSDINRGLFMVRPDFLPAYTVKTAVAAGAPASIGQTVAHTVTVTNIGNQTDSYTVALSGNSWNTTTSTMTVGPLAPNEEATVTISVVVGGGISDSVSMTLTSQGNNDVWRAMELTTQATMSAHQSYLPIIR